jgi:hypothetical protein
MGYAMCSCFLLLDIHYVRRPMPIPTRTRVSRDALPLIMRSSSHSTTPFSNKRTIVEPPKSMVSNMLFALKQNARTKREVPKLFAPLDLVTLLLGREDRSDHHGTDADCHDSAEDWAVERHNFPCVFAVYVKRGTDGLRLSKQS